MAANYERLMRCKQTGEPLVKQRPKVPTIYKQDREMLRAMYDILHRFDKKERMVS